MTGDQLRAAIRAAGLKATLARVAVLSVLARNAAPMSQAEICAQLAADDQDRSTVYRNLVDFAQAGLVRRVTTGDRTWRFEYLRAGQTRAHPHFVCVRCGQVTCLVGAALELAGARVRVPGAAQRRDVEVVLHGVCDACA